MQISLTLVAFLSFNQISQAQIAFVSDRDGNVEIYVMDADGNNPRNLTNHPAPDYQPDWLILPNIRSPLLASSEQYGDGSSGANEKARMHFSQKCNLLKLNSG